MKQDIAEYNIDTHATYEPDGVRGIWCHGDKGTGKSHWARAVSMKKYQEKPYDKGANKWWDSYTNQKVALIDDVDPKKMEHLGHFLKQWTDKFAVTGETKGGHVQLNHHVLIITSNWTIEECFPDPVMGEAIASRFVVKEFTTSYIEKRLPSTAVTDLLDIDIDQKSSNKFEGAE